MKRFLSVCLGVVPLAIVLTAATSIAAQPKGKSKPTIAIFELENKAGDKWTMPKTFLDWFEDFFRAELVKRGKVKVLSRKQVEARLKAKGVIWEQEWPEPKVKAMEIGKALGVEYLLTSTITEYGMDEIKGQKQTKMTMKAKVINTSSGEVVWTDQAQSISDGFTELGFRKAAKSCVKQLAKKFSSIWSTFEQ